MKWLDNVTTVDLHKNFLELLMVDLCHYQLITESTHKSGKILDLLFTNIPELIDNVSVLGYKETCSSDQNGVNFKIKLDVPMKKTEKRKVYNYSKADWRVVYKITYRRARAWPSGSRPSARANKGILHRNWRALNFNIIGE